MECDHVVGSFIAKPVRSSQWAAAAATMSRAVHFFNTTRLAVPHPCFLSAHRFCTDCAAPLDYKANSLAVGVALEHHGLPEFDLDTYRDWVHGGAKA